MEPTCPQCHTTVRLTDYYCYNCGKNLHPKPLSVSLGTLFMYYLGTIAIPPMGIIWGIKYLREESQIAKIHGIMMISVTIVELILLSIWTVDLMNTVNKQINGQLNGQINGQLNGMQGL